MMSVSARPDPLIALPIESMRYTGSLVMFTKPISEGVGAELRVAILSEILLMISSALVVNGFKT